ncbi:oligosaccharide flippase family protein [Lactococcus petauri]|uniref:oligosaccharide flippase family protein n=1 Tax=Lactococcus petauri TaxID=1940789 RepID=UPI0024349373|nr:oligosaccharide flippase family protein [Lactococcus petauri]MDG6137314.1 oligosaccharide flippase family protein [Lactococcus petauri]
MRVLKNFFYSASYQLLAIILPLITAPYISRVLEPEGIGINTITYSTTQYFVLFAALGTMTYGNREIAYYQNNKAKRSEAFWEINFLSWITSTISIIAFLIFIYFVGEYKEIYLWQGIAIFASMFDISWYFMGVEKFKITVIRNFIIKIITVISIFEFVNSPSDLPIYVAILTIGMLLGNLSLWSYLKNEIYPPNFNKLNLKVHLKHTLSLFVPTITIQIYSALNRNMIGSLDSVISAGYFDQSDKIVKLSLSLVSSVGVVMLPRISNLFSTGDLKNIKRLFIKTFDIVTGVSTGICFGLMAISFKFAPFFFGNEYKFVGIIMMIEAPVIIFTTWGIIFSNQYLVPLNNLKPLTSSVIIGTVVNIILNIFTIPLFGVTGATVNIIISEFIITLCKYLSVRKDFPISILFKSIWKYLLSGIIMFCVVFGINNNYKMSILQLILQIGTGVILYSILNIILRTELYYTLSNIIKKRKI